MALLGKEKYLFSGQPVTWKDTCVVQLSWSGGKECTHGAATPLDTMCFLAAVVWRLQGRGTAIQLDQLYLCLLFDSFGLGGCYDNCHPSF